MQIWERLSAEIRLSSQIKNLEIPVTVGGD